MRRAMAAGLLALLVLGVQRVRGEEISLKDGTKLVGHMTAINGDKIEIETAYGKIEVKRSDILTIRFPENGAPPATEGVIGGVIGGRPQPGSATMGSVAMPLPKIDETLNGTSYTNRTGNFTLTVPPGWKSTTAQRRYASTIASLASADDTLFAGVTQEQYPGKLESYKDYVLMYTRRNFDGVEELGQTPGKIDGKDVIFLQYRGNSKESKMPLQFLTALVPAGSGYLKVSAWCVEPLFHEMQPRFETILKSYHATAGTTPAPGSKP